MSGGLSPREANNYLALIAALALIVGFGLTGSGPETSFAQTTDPRPNIVFVLTDDLRADDLRFMPRTRKLLAERGVRFSNAFSTRSLCCPSRATILRGQYAHNHLVWGNAYPLGSFYKFRELGHEGSTIATWLNDAGYDTVLTGKYLNKYDNTTYRPPGWDRWNAYLGTYYGDRYQINENGNIRTYHRSRFHDTDLLADKAAYFIRHPPTSSGAPFFMHLSPYAPHHPAHAARRHGGMFSDQPLPNTPAFNERDVSDKPEWVRDKPRLSPDAVRNTTQFYRQRLRALQSVGEMIGQLVDVLRETGELSNTYIVLTSDNGLHLGVHRLSEKSSAYEEAIRVPLLVRGPGVPRGTTRPQLVLNNDLAPTFADLAGVTPTTPVDGRSLSPLLSATSPASWRTAFLVEHRSSTNEYPSVRAIPAYDAVRSADHLYVEYETGEKELYNLRRDPYELTSRHDSAPQTLLSELKGRLEALKVCTRADTSATSCKTAEDG